MVRTFPSILIGGFTALLAEMSYATLLPSPTPQSRTEPRFTYFIITVSSDLSADLLVYTTLVVLGTLEKDVYLRNRQQNSATCTARYRCIHILPFRRYVVSLPVAGNCSTSNGIYFFLDSLKELFLVRGTIAYRLKCAGMLLIADKCAREKTEILPPAVEAPEH